MLSYDTSTGEAQFVLQWVSLGVTCLMYLAVIIFGLRNFFKYIVKQHNQLTLFYVFIVLAAASRLGTYGAMIYNLIAGEEMHTQLSVMADLVISSLQVAAGMCMALIMFKLYTYLQCWSIFLYN